jgi:signal recognition particle receptor subunit beta
MVFFNYATMQMAAKIVYYGPGLCGKTTNLHHIYTKTSPGSRGEMVSLETETDRTLFFDLLPIDVGVIGGFKTRLQLYTVPGQVFYNTTRKLVLKGVDGIVFVADSQSAILEANVESLKNLRENLHEIGVDLDELPVVVQLNKRDLPSIAPVDVMMNALDPERRLEYVESVASTGVGVFETLKLISKLTLRTLRRRMTGEEPIRSAPTRPQFKVRETMSGNVALPDVDLPDDDVIASAVDSRVAPIAPAAPPPPPPSFDPDATVAATSIDPHMLMHAPVTQEAPFAEDVVAVVNDMPDVSDEGGPDPEPAPIEEPPADPEPMRDPEPEPAPAPPPAREPEPEPEISFSETEKPQKAEPEVKTMKVRSAVDVMAELESLRKRATQTTPKTVRRDVMADLESLRPKRDLHRTLHLQLSQDVLARARMVRVTLSFEDGDAGVIETQNQHLELTDTSDAQSLSVNLKIDLS